MLTLADALRRSAMVTLGLVALAGTAVAQDSPDVDDDTSPEAGTPDPNDPISPNDPNRPNDPTTPDDPVEPVDQGTQDNIHTEGTHGTQGTAQGVPQTTPPDQDIDVIVTPPPPVHTTPTYTDTSDVDNGSDNTLERYGVAVALGGGVEGFTNETLRGATDDGGNWNVRLAIGTRSPIGFEAAYIGSAQSIQALGLDEDALLIGNGVDGRIRVNVLDFNVQPFVFAGVGWRRYGLARVDTNTSAVQDSDDVLEVPLGAGIAYKYRGFLLDARGEFRVATQEDLMPALTAVDDEDTRAEMHRWGVNANIGVAF